MDLGIDLPAMKNKRGKTSMSRGLLDIWNERQAARFGSTFGTAAKKESDRRDIKTRMAK